MASRRSRGDGGLYWSEDRQRWIAELTIGYRPNGKRITRKASGKTKTEAKAALDRLVERKKEGTATAVRGLTVEKAVRDWLRHGLNGRTAATVEKLTILAETHIVPSLGARLLLDPKQSKELTADDVDAWLEEKAEVLATRTLQDLRSILRRAINRAAKRTKGIRNAVLLGDELPVGRDGRPSKSLTFAQAVAVLAAAEAEDSTYGDYTVVSLLTGARTEEARPLAWPEVDLVGKLEAAPPIPPHVNVWRSVRAGGDTKTKKSRRSLALPGRAVEALERQKLRQKHQRESAGDRWQELGIVFASDVGTQLDAANVRRGFRRILKLAGLEPKNWTPRELRHSFVSLLSDSGLTIEEISRLVGQSDTKVTELVYRHQLRPVIQNGSKAMDAIFSSPLP
ncbi:phage integrase [Amycolatopsis mediterranei S699]|uniref:Phage integrase n=2 Tax=Amycolatopsis mediterranei TaxID=33910 RepID=A0A9R0U3T3_AMYMS|nr:site-specific integrase [Amycolatopsis mediterranei]ADJ41835.1 putative phage integrase [Amycolatopsis mediterranei U32]AEK38505.1 phage integrase [Amycolatopsis mediterranei S699]AFO73546.1 phage integrase [Amycolatopsis mediterranei S699]AGT80674.1 phage integrase [Amycolatopsis mediterranei RB]KDO11941.1 integrase [Amycolatopsis mediterranei]